MEWNHGLYRHQLDFFHRTRCHLSLSLDNDNSGRIFNTAPYVLLTRIDSLCLTIHGLSFFNDHRIVDQVKTDPANSSTGLIAHSFTITSPLKTLLMLARP